MTMIHPVRSHCCTSTHHPHFGASIPTESVPCD